MFQFHPQQVQMVRLKVTNSDMDVDNFLHIPRDREEQQLPTETCDAKHDSVHGRPDLSPQSKFVRQAVGGNERLSLCPTDLRSAVRAQFPLPHTRRTRNRRAALCETTVPVLYAPSVSRFSASWQVFAGLRLHLPAA